MSCYFSLLDSLSKVVFDPRE